MPGVQGTDQAREVSARPWIVAVGGVEIVAGQDDDVGMQSVDRLDEALGEVVGALDVQVADLHDASRPGVGIVRVGHGDARDRESRGLDDKAIDNQDEDEHLAGYVQQWPQRLLAHGTTEQQDENTEAQGESAAHGCHQGQRKEHRAVGDAERFQQEQDDAIAHHAGRIGQGGRMGDARAAPPAGRAPHQNA